MKQVEKGRKMDALNDTNESYLDDLDDFLVDVDKLEGRIWKRINNDSLVASNENLRALLADISKLADVVQNHVDAGGRS